MYRTAKHELFRRREHSVLRLTLRAVAVLLGVLLPFDVGWAQATDKKAESHWNFRPALPSVPNLRPFRQTPSIPEANGYANLPGLGGTAPKMPPPPSSLGAQFIGGSLAFAPSNELVPAVYVEGRGYIPIGDPSIRPYLKPEDIAQPEFSPYVAMIPMSAIGGQSVSASVVMVEPSGRTLSFGPTDDNAEPITISANSGWSRTEGKHDLFFLDGDCCVRQGRNAAQGPHAVVWIERNAPTPGSAQEVVVYMESGDDETPIHIDFDSANVNANMVDKKWSGRFSTTTRINTLIVRQTTSLKDYSAIYKRGLQMISPIGSVIQQVQFVQGAAAPKTTSGAGMPPFKRIRCQPRNGLSWDFNFEKFPDDPERGIGIFSGFNMVIEGVNHQLLLGKVIDISADHAVTWGPYPLSSEDKSGDYEVYLEGNIVFRDGERRIEAHRMYYDTKAGVAYILDTKLISPIIGIPGVKGSIRLQTENLQMTGDGRFTAKNGFVSTSMLGEPTYSLHARSMKFDDSNNRQFLVTENNYVAVGKLPILYWPWMAADMKDPTFYLRNISFGTDTYDGQRIRTNWNPFQLLNIRNRPSWLDADLEVQWIEMRGFGHGFDVDYKPETSLQGFVRFWGISDNGADNLGGGRRDVDFPHHYRYRFFWQHAQEIPSFGILSPSPWLLNAKIGKTSDHNFINSYFLNEWNESENRTTSLELKKPCGNSSVSIFTEYALDDFYTNSNWLPRGEHTLLGESLLRDHLTWYEHTRVGFADVHTATSPYDVSRDGNYSRYLPWELQTNTGSNLSYNSGTQTINTSGEVFSTRHELDLPFNIGPVRCVPFVLGDFSHWGRDRNDDSVDRLYGQAGVRLNLPFWKVFPQRSSRTWYVNGLAHKIDVDTEFSYARSNRNMEDLILYDSLDNWSIEDARRRYWYGTYRRLGFGVFPEPSCPVWFDPRYYALRSGMGGRVTAANMEIADDLTLCRFGTTHRFQTKRGPVGKRRIIDWITVSAHFNYYPEAEQNAGESIGLIDYDFLWNVGDRFAFFSSGIYDVFEYGQNVTRIGGTWQRPGRGSLTLNVDQLYGVFKQTVLMLSSQYYFNEKYSITYSTSYDMANDWRNLGHTFMFVRTGESFRFLVGAVYREATDEWSFSFGLEPIFLRGIANKMNRAATQMSAANATR